MKKSIALFLSLVMLFALGSCVAPYSPITTQDEETAPESTFEEELTPEEEHDKLMSDLKNAHASVGYSKVHINLDVPEVFLLASVKNNTQKSITDVTVAFCAWDIDGKPVMIKTASGLTAANYTVDMGMGDVTIAAGDEWQCETDTDVFGLRLEPKLTNISYVEAIVVSYTNEDGAQWTNPCYYDWKAIFSGNDYQDYMKPDADKDNSEAETPAEDLD